MFRRKCWQLDQASIQLELEAVPVEADTDD